VLNIRIGDAFFEKMAGIFGGRKWYLDFLKKGEALPPHRMGWKVGRVEWGSTSGHSGIRTFRHPDIQGTSISHWKIFTSNTRLPD